MAPESRPIELAEPRHATHRCGDEGGASAPPERAAHRDDDTPLLLRPYPPKIESVRGATGRRCAVPHSARRGYHVEVGCEEAKVSGYCRKVTALNRP
jgi:hypothetical protein